MFDHQVRKLESLRRFRQANQRCVAFAHRHDVLLRDPGQQFAVTPDSAQVLRMNRSAALFPPLLQFQSELHVGGVELRIDDFQKLRAFGAAEHGIGS